MIMLCVLNARANLLSYEINIMFLEQIYIFTNIIYFVLINLLFSKTNLTMKHVFMYLNSIVPLVYDTMIISNKSNTVYI